MRNKYSAQSVNENLKRRRRSRKAKLVVLAVAGLLALGVGGYIDNQNVEVAIEMGAK